MFVPSIRSRGDSLRGELLSHYSFPGRKSPGKCLSHLFAPGEIVSGGKLFSHYSFPGRVPRAICPLLVPGSACARPVGIFFSGEVVSRESFSSRAPPARFRGTPAAAQCLPVDLLHHSKRSNNEDRGESFKVSVSAISGRF